MPKPSLIARMFRLQFSLRSLMVLMAVVGIGLVVFRWTWVATTQQSHMRSNVIFGADGPGHDFIERNTAGRWQHRWASFRGYFSANDVDDYRIVTSYRRGWNGKPQKNGVQQYWRLPDLARGSHTQSPLLVIEKHYVDDDLRRVIQYSDEGEITFSEGRRNGLPHGRSQHALGTGTYNDGKRVGDWQTSYQIHMYPGYDKAEEIRVQQSYRDGVLHGDWIWKAETGKRVLQTARYEDGQLVEWNRQPKKQAIEALLAKCNLSPATSAMIQRPAANVKLSELASNDERSITH